MPKRTSSVVVRWPEAIDATSPSVLKLRFERPTKEADRKKVESKLRKLLVELDHHGGVAGGASFTWPSLLEVECTVELALSPEAKQWLHERWNAPWPCRLVEVFLEPEAVAARRLQTSPRGATEAKASSRDAFEPIRLRHPDTGKVLVEPCIEVVVMACGKDAVVRAAAREFGTRWIERFPDSGLLVKGGDQKAYRKSSCDGALASWSSHFAAKGHRRGVLSLAAGKPRKPDAPALEGILHVEGMAARGCLPIEWATRPGELRAFVDELCAGLALTSGWCGISQHDLWSDNDARRWLKDQWGSFVGRGCPDNESWSRDFPGITLQNWFSYGVWGNMPHLLNVGWITLLGGDFAKTAKTAIDRLKPPIQVTNLDGGIVRILTADAPSTGHSLDDGRELQMRAFVGHALQKLRIPDKMLEHFHVGGLKAEQSRAYYLRFFEGAGLSSSPPPARAAR